MTALVIGYSGLVGSYLLQELVESNRYTSILLLGRSQPTIQNPKLKFIETNFSNLNTLEHQLKADDIFCCLGTTIKIAGSQEGFKKIDYEIPFHVAQVCKAQGAKQFMVVTAIDSNPQSKIFYSRVKGELERDLQTIGYQSLKIFRPSLLLGPRKEFRMGEKIFQWLQYLPFWLGPLQKYKPIQAHKVAHYMFHLAQKNDTGLFIAESDLMQ